MSDLLRHAETSVRYVTDRHDPEGYAGQATWCDAALADALTDCIEEIRKLRKEVDDLKHGQKQMGWEAAE